MLKAERDFVNLAESHMAQLRLVDGEAMQIAELLSAHGEDGQTDHFARVKIAQDIKVAAQEVKARAIAVAARRCEMLINKQFMTQINCLNPEQAALKIKTDLLLALRTLERLIGLYATGLREIDPEFGQEDVTESVQGSVQETAQADETIPASNAGALVGLDLELLQRQNEAAAQQLSEVIHLAPIGEHAALSRLIKIAAPHIDVPQAENRQEQVQAEPDMDASDAPSENLSAPLLDRVEPPAQIGLESLMATITDKALGMAHHAGRHISLSYDVGDRLVSTATAARISSRLDQICAALITHSFEPASKGGATQISITAAEAGLDITANGRAMSADIFANAFADKSPGHSDIAQIESDGIANHIRLSLTPQKAVSLEPDLLESFDCDLVHEFAPHIDASVADLTPSLDIAAGPENMERRI